jgi:hypothetical protein
MILKDRKISRKMISNRNKIVRQTRGTAKIQLPACKTFRLQIRIMPI